MVAALAAQATVTAITPRIGTRWSGTYPAIRITKVGSFFVDNEGAEDVSFQVECVADDDATASLLARTVVSVVDDLRGSYGGGKLALTDPTGPIPAYDEVAERARYDVTLDGRVTV